MLYLIGLGLGDAEDVSVKGLNIIKRSYKIYLEAYTSLLTVGKEKLEEYYEREIILADREMVEQGADEIIDEAKDHDVAFLVVGDPFGATTHTDLVLRAQEKGVPYSVVHNASILSAVGCCGLQLYSFGETVSIVFWTDDWKPDSFYDRILANRKRGLHTLCLMDLKIKEQSIENMMRKRKIYDPPRFMTVSQAAQQLLEIIERKKEAGDTDLGYSETTLCVGLAKVGSSHQRVVACTLEQMASLDLGPPLHSLIIAGKLHPLELDMLRIFALDASCLQHAELH